jgi:hypothetical protein
MPLLSGKKNMGRNIAELEAAGHPKKQSIAIAFKEAGEDSDTNSSREYDINDYLEIKENPISRTGVFEYSGAQISPDLPADMIFGVYRSEEELNNQETIDSFKLIPFTDEHEMLGNASEGLTDASKKGVHGTTGEMVEFNDPYLTANIKIFSEKLKDLIDSGKKELSIGYRCVYEAQNGEYDGKQYQYLQTNIRGNHLALVQEGRSGHDVSVLDSFKFTLDSKDLKMAEKDGDMEKEKGDMSKPKDKAKDEGERMSMQEMKEMLRKCVERMDSMSEDEFEDDLEAKEINRMDNETIDGNPDDFVHRENGIDEEEKAKDEEETEKKAEEEGDSKDESMMREEETGRKEGAMDSKTLKHVISQISARDSLAKRLAVHVGSFDHSSKTVDEVAQYGARKLGLKCTAKTAKYVLDGYLAGARTSTIANVEDRKIVSTSIDAYLKGDK